MGDNTCSSFNPDWCIHPGVTLQDCIDEGQTTCPALCLALGVDARTVDRLLDGSEPLTDELAERLGRHLGTSTEIWVNLERSFREGLAEGKMWIR